MPFVPTVSLYSPSGHITNSTPIPVEIHFTKDVNPFDLSDIVVSDGSLFQLAGEGTFTQFNLF